MLGQENMRSLMFSWLGLMYHPPFKGKFKHSQPKFVIYNTLTKESSSPMNDFILCTILLYKYYLFSDIPSMLDFHLTVFPLFPHLLLNCSNIPFKAISYLYVIRTLVFICRENLKRS